MERGEVVLAPFPYSNQRALKRRPACVVSASAYNEGPDVIVAMVTSSATRLSRPGFGDVLVEDWRAAGLLRPSVVRTGRILVIERPLLSGPLGSLAASDLRAVEEGLRAVLDLS